MPRILHVLDHSLPLHSGYTFRTRAILKSQIGAGWEVRGLTGVRQYQHGKLPDGDLEEAEGLQFFRTPQSVSGPSGLREWREILALERRIIEVHREWPFDIVHAHSPALNGLAAARAAAKLGLPFVYEIRAFWEDAAVGNGTGTEGSLKYRLTRALENHVVARADRVAVICEGLRSDLVARGFDAGKIFVSPNGVDMELFGNPPPRDEAFAVELGLTGRDVIGYIGSFYDYEGIDDLIAAMAHLNGAAKDAHLLLVGGGPMEKALRAQAEASPAADRIHFVGRVPHEEVERYYSLVDVLAYPRKRMRLTDLVTPLKPLEAMAQGRLVAASDVGGHRELIEDSVTGALFPADDPIGTARAIDSLFSDKSMWPARKADARAFVEQERNWQKNIMRYDPVYHFLLGRDKQG
ncbi:glycosyltransferase, exosortase A system-associated [Sphingorhabdus pulchriflava]|uniref:Glycosyltransferase, exosortase A system-associated n=1 Tax=Sphingorhabdus pulchriflava TaxID=2292257 RepID=A0A371BEK0_9SPHN|nr:TIGR04063 family PEP-CTERM/XrtA system glycosyltransferase [Sphingorhabdus pulchriflava]RDV06032.1 glycosyltransferase, exosortase A system-associated [Sphingorhabdus pulchriflava]